MTIPESTLATSDRQLDMAAMLSPLPNSIDSPVDQADVPQQDRSKHPTGKLTSPPMGNGQVRVEKLSFQVIQNCTYTPKAIGSSDQEALGCECGEEWENGRNGACGEDSDCINRLTKVECVDQECSCGAACQNQRFQLKQYAAVSVIQTEKKGYGLQANTALQAHDFIYEYIGEVINEPVFRRRMIQYDNEGIKHFYFMSLQNGVFVDATRKGNLGRFCNHSCNPNCYVDKWVVGDKLRMGIFAKRDVKAGEELVFNYNVDRYGADPQPCYCGEPNCTGFIGGRTQTERATKLPSQTLEALGIEDGEDWDVMVPKKAKKKKIGEADEDYVDRMDARPLDERGVTKVIPTLMQCKEQWIVVRLLTRIQQCESERVRNLVVKMHGYQTMSSTLLGWKEDVNIVLQVLDVLDKFPRLTKNKIADSKIETTIQTLVDSDDERVRKGARALLEAWSLLEVAYRIPRKKRDPNGTTTPDRPERPERPERRESSRDDRRDQSEDRDRDHYRYRSRSSTRSVSRSRSSRSRSRSPFPDAPRGPSSAPTGPRAHTPQRHANHFDPSRPPFHRRPFNPLPRGWMAAQDNGRTYYYSASGQTSWERPTTPAAQPPPPPKPVSNDQRLQEIIDNITKEKPKEKVAPPADPQPSTESREEPREPKDPSDKWRSLPVEKQKRIYETTLSPHIRYVMNKYKSKLEREELKRFGKEVAKTLVKSDYKHKRVTDPRHISARQVTDVKKYVATFFDKAVAKKRLHGQRDEVRKNQPGGVVESPITPVNRGTEVATPATDSDEGMKLESSDAEAYSPAPQVVKEGSTL